MIRNRILISNEEQWWTHSVVYFLPTLIMIYVFSTEAGIISKNLGKIKFINSLSKGSTYAFLIHYVLFKYINQWFDNCGIISEYREFYLLILGIILTGCTTYLYIFLINKK